MPPGETDPSDAVVGAAYEVSFRDCCVSGSFTAVLTGKNYVPDHPGEPFLESLTFANGVTVTGHGILFPLARQTTGHGIFMRERRVPGLALAWACHRIPGDI